MESYALELQNIEKEFPGVKALDRVSFRIKPGAIHAILGENGAGKSTLIKIIAGVYHKDGGRIILNSKECNFSSPMEAFAEGISVIHQETSLVDQLSAVQNVFLGIEHKKGRSVKILDEKSMRLEYEGLCKKVGFDIPPHLLVRDLSVAQQKIVEIIKALAHRSSLIIMDEPTDSLTNKEKTKLFEIIRDLKSHYVTTIYITHFLDEVFEIADWATVLRDGKMVGTSEVRDLNHESIVTMMVGKKLAFADEQAKSTVHTKGKALEVKDVSISGKVKNVSFTAHYGEVLGITGVIGAGKSELARALFGADNLEQGRILINEQELTISSPQAALHAGLGMLPENKKTQGLILKHETYKNISLCSLKEITRHGLLNKKQELQKAKELKKQLDIKVNDFSTQVMYLSGGNQQKIVIAKWLLADPSIIIMDEPTRGIDVGAKDEIFHIVKTLAEEGKCIIFISSEVPEVVKVCNRILVMSMGRIVKEFNEERDQDLILHYMLKGDERG